MADEDITLDGKPLQSLRVADLKAALEQRNLPKSGQKNTLIKRLKGVSFLSRYGRLCRVWPSSAGGERQWGGLTVEAVTMCVCVWAVKREYINRRARVITHKQQFSSSTGCN